MIGDYSRISYQVYDSLNLQSDKMKNTRYYYWYLFFCAYWAAFRLGEKEDPQINAAGLLVILTWMIILTFINIFVFVTGENFPFVIETIIGGMIFSLIINSIILFKKVEGYKSRVREFNFINNSDFSRKRWMVLLSTFFLFFIIMMISLVINNDVFQIWISS